MNIFNVMTLKCDRRKGNILLMPIITLTKFIGEVIGNVAPYGHTVLGMQKASPFFALVPQRKAAQGDLASEIMAIVPKRIIICCGYKLSWNPNPIRLWVVKQNGLPWHENVVIFTTFFWVFWPFIKSFRTIFGAIVQEKNYLVGINCPETPIPSGYELSNKTFRGRRLWKSSCFACLSSKWDDLFQHDKRISLAELNSASKSKVEQIALQLWYLSKCLKHFPQISLRKKNFQWLMESFSGFFNFFARNWLNELSNESPISSGFPIDFRLILDQLWCGFWSFQAPFSDKFRSEILRNNGLKFQGQFKNCRTFPGLLKW